ncbi:MAG: peptidase, partial [Thaumarchaeota archaeon]|nr:peptidase [Nitrososphaerota archaeon]
NFWLTIKTLGLSMIIVPIALFIWRLGIFGGADAFCLIVLGALVPMASIQSSEITPFTTLTNAAIISIVPLFVNLSRNLVAMAKREDIFNGIDETRLTKLVALFVGHRAKNTKYGFSMERIEGNQKRLDFGFRHAEKTQFCNASTTWITPAIPYILYISGGFAIQIIYGDVIVNLIKSIH